MSVKPVYSDGHHQLKDLIDKLVSHNEIIKLWYVDTSDPDGYHLMFHGMGWEIPDPYLELKVHSIFGCIAEKISESDAINILMDVDENGFTPDLPPKTHNVDGVEEGYGC